MTTTTIMIMMTTTMMHMRINYTHVIFMESGPEVNFKSQGYFDFNSLALIPESFMYPHLMI